MATNNPMSGLEPKPTQTQKILRVLQDAEGGWVNGRKFAHEMYLSQFHARIKELEMRGVEIEHSEFTDEFGFKSYRLVRKEPAQMSLV